MTDSKSIAMHEDFPSWYKTVTIAADAETLQQRWVGLVSFLNSATREDLESLVRLVFRTKQGLTSEAYSRLRKAFKDADKAFEMHGNNRELEVLAGSALAVLSTQQSQLAASASLSIITAACESGRPFDMPMDLVGMAEAALVKLSEAERSRPDLATLATYVQPAFDLESAAAKVKAQYDANGVAGAFTTAGETIRSALAKVEQRLAHVVAATTTYLTVQDEELQMLWWFIGERSWDFDRPFASLGDAQPLVLAKELACLTQRLPGPVSVKALLSRAGLKTRNSLTLPAAINACDSPWLEHMMKSGNPSPVTQPIHFAASRKLETQDEKSWIAGWAATTGLSADRTLPALRRCSRRCARRQNGEAETLSSSGRCRRGRARSVCAIM